jgi:hypothetical protein
MVMVRGLRRVIAIIVNGEHGGIRRVVIMMILSDLMVVVMMMVMIMVGQIDGEGTSEGIGRVGLAAGVQRPIHHRHGRLNHEHGDQHHGQSRRAFPKMVVQMLEQVSLDGVIVTA